MGFHRGSIKQRCLLMSESVKEITLSHFEPKMLYSETSIKRTTLGPSQCPINNRGCSLKRGFAVLLTLGLVRTLMCEMTQA